MRFLPGLIAIALILAVVGAALIGLFTATGPETTDLPWRYVEGVVRFTLLQSALSTLLSLAIGASLALALARRSFPGRALFIAALNLASVLPAIVAVFGIVAVLGRAGWVGEGLRMLGFNPGSWLYGLPGILIGHVFFNAPLAARVFLGSLATVPGEHWRLAAQLGMRPFSLFRLLDWPVLWREVPALAALIFLLCFTSFAIVLALGGGPGTATLEVAIYGAVRFDVDFARAGLLALLQIAICAAITLPLLLWMRRPAETAVVGATWRRPDADDPRIRAFDVAVLVAGALLVLPPLAAVAISGAFTISSLFRSDVGQAMATSFAIALPGSALALLLALGIAVSARNLRARGQAALASALAAPAGLTLALPPVAISAGLFVALRDRADPFALAIPLIILVNALTALPFVLRQLEPPLALSAERYGRLAESLGVSGFWRIKLIDWPILRKPFAAAFAVAAALSLGDLGVAAFFGSGSILTLPLLIYQRMGSYRMAESASVALLLSLLVLALFLAAQKWSGDTLARSR